MRIRLAVANRAAQMRCGAVAPDEFGALIRSELKKWAKVVKDAGIQPV